ncbi:NAD(P)-dependent oxidoreductase [Rhodovibrionaceae bacterium A322]
MKAFPLFLKIDQQEVLLLGGGSGAEAKARLLLAAGAKLIVVAVTPGSTLVRWAKEDKLTLLRRDFQPSDLDGAVLAVAADVSEEQSQLFYREAKGRGIPVNVVDRPDLSSFVMPAVIDRSPVVIAISTFGAAPVLARRLRASIESLLPARLGQLADFAQRYRGAVKAQFSDFDGRRRFWERFFDGPVAAKVLAGDSRSAQVDMLAELNQQDALDAVAHTPGAFHHVAVPQGDPDLLTLRDFRLLQTADLLLHEETVSPPLLAMARRDASFVRLQMPQDPSTLAQDYQAKTARGQTVIFLSVLPSDDQQEVVGNGPERRAISARQLQLGRC